MAAQGQQPRQPMKTAKQIEAAKLKATLARIEKRFDRYFGSLAAGARK